jgi:hypothetical protein
LTLVNMGELMADVAYRHRVRVCCRGGFVERIRCASGHQDQKTVGWIMSTIALGIIFKTWLKTSGVTT